MTKLVITVRSLKPLIQQWREQQTGLTDEEYEFLIWDIDNAIRQSNAEYLPKPIKIPDITLSEEDRETCLVWLKSREMAADPEEKERFRIMIDGVDF